MPKQKYTANIVTDTLEYTAKQMQKMRKMMKNRPPLESTIQLMRLLWMDQKMVKDASMYMECIWLWKGKTTSGTTEEPHIHEFDEVIGFISTDKENPFDLDARMEIVLGDETHFLTKSCLIHVPAGMKHCPLTFREINRPVFFFTLAPIGMYSRDSNTIDPKGQSDPLKERFIPPEADSSGTRYGRYITTYAKPKPPRKGPPTAESTRVVSLDDSVSKGAFYVDFAWIWSGTTTMAPGQGHTHAFDEMIGIVGFDRKHPRELGGEVNIMLGDEKYNLTKSCIIFVPKGLKHCPLEFINIRKPVLCFTVGNTTKYSAIQQ